MNKIVLILPALIANCGQADWSGLRYTSKKPVDETMLSYTLDSVQYYFSVVMHDDSIDVEETLTEFPVMINFVPSMPVVGDQQLHGQTAVGIPTNITVQSGECYDFYYLSHELLHWLVEVKGIATAQDSYDHNVPGVFLEWALDSGNHPNSTVEWWLALDIRYECSDNLESKEMLDTLLQETF